MRGTGKTTRLLKAAPRDSVFIVQPGMQEYIKHWIKESGRAKDKIDVVSTNSLVTLRGLRKPLTIDHTVTDSMILLSPEQREELSMLRYVSPFTVMTDIDGDIIVEYNQR